MIRFAAACLTLLVLAPAGASAGTVSVSSQTFSDEKSSDTSVTVRYVAAAGERNNVTAALDTATGVATVTDVAGVTAGAGCAIEPEAPLVIAHCIVQRGASTYVGLQLELADGDDRAQVGSGWSTAEADGGDGDDRLAAEYRAVLVGGPGRDVLLGGSGDDVLEGGAGDDEIVGGAGFDTVSYGSARGPVVVDLAAGSGGGPSEHDLIAPDVESVQGGSGGDHLLGTEGPNELDGGPGDDELSGRGGNDVLRGGGGRDTMLGGPGDDDLSSFAAPGAAGPSTLDGGEGDDHLSGSGSADRMTGGPGLDDFVGDGGADRIDARDTPGTPAETVFCDPPTGSPARAIARVDAGDLALDCGGVRRTGAPRGYAGRLGALPSDLEDGRSAFLALGCSQDMPRRCSIHVVVRDARGRVGGRRTFRLRPNDYEENEAVPLSGGVARDLQSMGRLPLTFDITFTDAHGAQHHVRRTHEETLFLAD